ncbi:hypothetical protein DFP72DRAFT_1175561 [Ephemerocybe angulata]|uniref:Uncharacterized protein n=1 Tax=Ephemerocybe angulata TaxID=980116 RepID=A0A8H6LXM3_9AGAR|nr:hypothetical protein DFP72DRAFT_1175561 [Tulosesus angulatus]
MRVSVLISTTVFLATFVNAYYEPAVDARDIDSILERREHLGGLSTRDLISELSNRLERRHKQHTRDLISELSNRLERRNNPNKPKQCAKCGATIGDSGKHKC